MQCPFCHHHEFKVTDSRIAADINAIKRRRECLNCKSRFTTFETIDLSIQVKKRNGTYEDFQQEKLLKGLDAACRHSKISHDQVRSLVYRITADLAERQIREISSQELGDIVMNYLNHLDVVAYIRFACVYKRFKNIDDLVLAIEAIQSKDKLSSDQKKDKDYDVQKG
ncbi:MAG: transcriptional repressor NrdR [Parachlamydiales bacterium]|nr:transcriptional repressor NrdR [Parachlamydiales bacterium]